MEEKVKIEGIVKGKRVKEARGEPWLYFTKIRWSEGDHKRTSN